LSKDLLQEQNVHDADGDNDDMSNIGNQTVLLLFFQAPRASYLLPNMLHLFLKLRDDSLHLHF